MGSRGRAALVRRQLLEAGADAARVEAVQAPIGLAIGAKTAEEIALSILAQIVEVKNARPQTEGFAPALLAAMEQAAQNGQPAALATIIARHGSTPREVGSKMLLLPDGTTVGSVGGGIMEYRTRQAAAEMLAGHTASVQTVTFSADGKTKMPRLQPAVVPWSFCWKSFRKEDPSNETGCLDPGDAAAATLLPAPSIVCGPLGCGCLYWKPLTRRLSGGRCRSAKLCTKVKQR